MRAGIPVLASNTGGPLETIVEGETGWLRDANNVQDWTDVMDKVLYGLDQESTQRMAVAGKARAEKEFSLTAMGDRLEKEIGDMLRCERRPFNGSQQLLLLLSLSGIALSVLAFWVIKAM